MELTNRALAAMSTLAMVIVLFVVPGMAAEATAPGKIQDRVAAERFSAPGLIQSASLDAQQLMAHGAARAARQDRLAFLPNECRQAAWPSIPLRCLFADDGVDRSERQVRVITVEERVGTNTSVLIRVPAEVAQR